MLRVHTSLMVIPVLMAFVVAPRPGRAQATCHRIRMTDLAVSDESLREVAGVLTTALRRDTTSAALCWLPDAPPDSAQFALMGGVARMGADSIAVTWQIVNPRTTAIVARGRARGATGNLGGLVVRLVETVAAAIRQYEAR